MTQKDVEIRIRAKANADKDLERVAKILKGIDVAAEDSVDALNHQNAVIRKVAESVARLDQQIDKLSSYKKLVVEVDKATAAVEGMQKQLLNSANDFAKAARQQDEMRQASVRYRAQIDSEKDSLAELKLQRDADAKSLKQVERDLSKAQKAVEKYNAALSKKGVDPATDSGSAARSTVVNVLSRSRDELAGSVGRLDNEIAQSTARLADLNTRSQSAAASLKTLTKQVDEGAASVARNKIQLEEQKRVLTATTTAAQQASAALGGLASDQNAIDAATARATAELREQQAVMNRMKQAQRDLDAANRERMFGDREALSIYQRIRAEVLALITAYVGLHGVISAIQGALNVTRAMDAAQNRLATVFDQDYARVGEEMDFIRGTADRLGIAMVDLSDSYSKFAVSANLANLSNESTRRVFLSVAEAGRVNKLSTDQMNAIFLAMTQIMNKGKFMAEELQGQLGERLPGAMSLLAQSLGVTTGELMKMMEQGQVLATEENLLAFADTLGKVFGGQLPAALLNISTEMGRFENDINKVQEAMAEGLIPGLRDALNAFNAFVNSTEGQEFFVNLGAAIGQALEALAWLIDNFELVKYTLIAILALNVGATVAGWAMSFAAFAANALKVQGALAGASKAAVIARAAFTAMGGMVGIGLTVAATLGTVMAGHWASSKIGTEQATLALSEHERQMRAVNEAYQTANTTTGKWYENIRNLTKLDVEQNGRDLAAAYNAALDDIRSGLNEVEMAMNILTSGKYEFAAYFQIDFVDEADLDQQIAEFQAYYGQIKSIIDQLGAGTLSAGQAKTMLSTIASEADNDLIRDAASAVDELLDKARDNNGSLEDLQKALAENAELQVLFGSNASEAAKALLKNRKATEETGDSQEEAAKQAKIYADALDEIKGKIPSLADDMKRLKEETELTATAWAGMVAAFNSGDYGKIAAILAALGQYGLEQRDARLNGAVGGGFVDRLIGIESAGDPNAQNPNSTATGLGQFIESTWLSLFKKYYPEQAKGMTDAMILAKRTDAELSKAMIELYARENAAVLDRAGIALSDANLYLAHFLGPQGAAALLKASPTTPVDQILGADQIAANRSILEGKTAGQVSAWAQRKMGVSDAEIAGAERLSEIERDRAEEAAKQAEATSQRIQDMQFEVDQQALINAGREKEAAIAAAIRDAKAENKNITDAELMAVEELAAKNWELANAKSAITLEEEKVNNLMALRSELEAQRDLAVESGNTTLASSLGEELTTINAQITEAIDNLIRMWEAAGGPEAELAIAKLRTAKMEVANTKAETTKLGLTFGTWQSSIGNFVNGLVNAFDAMATAIANGENAAKAFGTAIAQAFAGLLRDIALAIIKQMILNALMAVFGGPTTFMGGVMKSLGAVAPTGHTGGLVGGSAIGSGNSISSGASAWRSGLSYHTGGLAGLKPNEVNATLLQNEEILTEQDPRHRFNLGGESTPAQQGIRQVLAIGDDEIANAMSGRAGEKTILTTLRRNIPTLKQMLS